MRNIDGITVVRATPPATLLPFIFRYTTHRLTYTDSGVPTSRFADKHDDDDDDSIRPVGTPAR
jgi:hypothetical protein